MPSCQSCLESQNNSLAMHSPEPHWSWPSGHTGSRVCRLGLASLGLDRRSQLLTLAFQSQVCLSRSKARPEGHFTEASLMVPATPALSHLTTSLQSPSVVRRKYSLAVLSSQRVVTSSWKSWKSVLPKLAASPFPLNWASDFTDKAKNENTNPLTTE